MSGRMQGLAALRSAVARIWARVRPRSRREALVAAGIISGGAAALSLVLVGLLWIGLALAAPYLEVTLHPERNAQVLAGAERRYAGIGTCTGCHEPEVSRLTTSKHAAIGCESCHGALRAHAASSPGPEVDALIGTPNAALCLRCHAESDGRPPDFAQVVVADTTSTPAWLATTHIQGSRSDRRPSSTRSSTCRRASPAMATTPSAGATSAIRWHPKTTRPASPATSPDQGERACSHERNAASGTHDHPDRRRSAR